ncbi:Ribonuclease HII [Alkalidesulfovibrio alkalitolerans DSM 16529]|uniref:Ribonuclease HII n=1 Tax=Alkalidesulfovibrio alkalitolerans DSM 16529 TaxID=1121439 RepID=S7T950_9BACT|nr:Ribonuclease HII [Alkalidesulfovibrio alkalitolerans DSM 16529]
MAAFSLLSADGRDKAAGHGPWPVGIDEAGRGCLAGPVVAAAVILPPAFDLPGLTDSKKLSAARRETLAIAIRATAIAWRLGVVWQRDIDRLNILQATFLAMAKAVRRLPEPATLLLVDGNRTIPLPLPGNPRQQAVVGGDALVPAISAASILAKTFRDALMHTLDRRHPGYGLAEHKGYGTAEHRAALRRLGPSNCHRLTFAGVVEDQCRLPGL